MNWGKLSLTLGLLAWYFAVAIGFNVLSGTPYGWVVALPLAPAAAMLVGLIATFVAEWWNWVTSKE